MVLRVILLYYCRHSVLHRCEQVAVQVGSKWTIVLQWTLNVAPIIIIIDCSMVAFAAPILLLLYTADEQNTEQIGNFRYCCFAVASVRASCKFARWIGTGHVAFCFFACSMLRGNCLCITCFLTATNRLSILRTSQSSFWRIQFDTTQICNLMMSILSFDKTYDTYTTHIHIPQPHTIQ